MTSVTIQKYKANWSHTKSSERLLRELTREGKTLHLCCGKSRIGDLRVDIDQGVEPDLVGDIFNLPSEVTSQRWDNVIMDPPFSYYNRFKWLLPISDLAEKRFILSTSVNNFVLKHFDRTFYVVADKNSLFIRIWQLFQRKQNRLSIMLIK